VDADSAMFDLAMLSDIGGRWPDMEDAHGQWTADTGELVFAVADGVGGSDGGEIASRLAITKTLETYRESPVSWGPAKRLYHAAQQANVAIHNRAIAGGGPACMSTTLTAAAVADGMLRAVYVGDTRLYLVRGDEVRCLTKDHTVAGERARLTWVDEDAILDDPDRSKLTRSLGTTLIAPLDRLSLKLEGGDQLVLCTDGVYTLLHQQEIGDYCRGQAAKRAAKSLLAAAKRRNPTDNLTVAVLTVPGGPEPAAPDTWRERLFGLLRRAD
jgi:PPM family protein phosphatase